MAPQDDSLVFGTAAFACGLFVLERGADKFIDSSAVVARRIGVSPTLVGLLTCGAEWEELVVVAVAMARGESDLALGNVVGSAVANVLGSFSLGLMVFAWAGTEAVVFDRSARVYTALSLGLASVFLLLVYLVPAGLEWLSGVILLVAFVVYVVSVTRLIYRGTLRAPEDSDSNTDSDSDSDSESDFDSVHDGAENGTLEPYHDDESTIEDTGAQPSPQRSSEGAPLASSPDAHAAQTANRARRKPLLAHVSQLLLGLVMLLLSGYVIARSASLIGTKLGLTGTVTGTTILSIATTLPEKVVAVMAGARRQPGLMVANTVGSNIFLVTLCAGVIFVAGGGEVDARHRVSLVESLALWVSAAMLLVVVLVPAGRLGRLGAGLVMLACYVLFLVLELGNGRREGAAYLW